MRDGLKKYILFMMVRVFVYIQFGQDFCFWLLHIKEPKKKSKRRILKQGYFLETLGIRGGIDST